MYAAKSTRWFDTVACQPCGYGVKCKPRKGDKWHYVAKGESPLLFDLEYDACAFAMSMMEGNNDWKEQERQRIEAL